MLVFPPPKLAAKQAKMRAADRHTRGRKKDRDRDREEGGLSGRKRKKSSLGSSKVRVKVKVKRDRESAAEGKDGGGASSNATAAVGGAGGGEPGAGKASRRTKVGGRCLGLVCLSACCGMLLLCLFQGGGPGWSPFVTQYIYMTHPLDRLSQSSGLSSTRGVLTGAQRGSVGRV